MSYCPTLISLNLITTCMVHGGSHCVVLSIVNAMTITEEGDKVCQLLFVAFCHHCGGLFSLQLT